MGAAKSVSKSRPGRPKSGPRSPLPPLRAGFREQVKKCGRDACIYMLRKTSPQYDRAGQDATQSLAKNARVSEGFMIPHYVQEDNLELQSASNAMHQRLCLSMPPRSPEPLAMSTLRPQSWSNSCGRPSALGTRRFDRSLEYARQDLNLQAAFRRRDPFGPRSATGSLSNTPGRT